MSYPNLPNITPTITIKREDVINLLLASIAMEELSLAHIINSEGEKIPDPHRFYLGIMASPEIADTYATTNDPAQEWFIEFVNAFYSPKLSYTAGLDFLFLLNQRITFQ